MFVCTATQCCFTCYCISADRIWCVLHFTAYSKVYSLPYLKWCWYKILVGFSYVDAGWVGRINNA